MKLNVVDAALSTSSFSSFTVLFLFLLPPIERRFSILPLDCLWFIHLCVEYIKDLVSVHTSFGRIGLKLETNLETTRIALL